MADGSGSEQKSGVRVDRIGFLDEDEFWSPVQDEYIASITNMSAEEVYPSPNPGPSNPDGTVNFECHCVGHLVASPCGFEFREAISCQKASQNEENPSSGCEEQLLRFMDCVMKTNCFKPSKDEKKDE